MVDRGQELEGRSKREYVEQLQAIHALRDRLELSQQEYRALLLRLTGTDSAKLMTPEQREAVIAFMRMHEALDQAVEYAEAARRILNESFRAPPPGGAEETQADG